MTLFSCDMLLKFGQTSTNDMNMQEYEFKYAKLSNEDSFERIILVMLLCNRLSIMFRTLLLSVNVNL